MPMTVCICIYILYNENSVNETLTTKSRDRNVIGWGCSQLNCGFLAAKCLDWCWWWFCCRHHHRPCHEHQSNIRKRVCKSSLSKMFHKIQPSINWCCCCSCSEHKMKYAHKQWLAYLFSQWNYNKMIYL